MDRFYAHLGTRLPLALFQIPFSLLGIMQTVMRSPRSFVRMFDSSLCPADKELFRHGSKGPAYDAQTVYKDWGFHLSDTDVHIEVFQGTADMFVPPIFSDYLAKTARDVRINSIAGQGHFYNLAYGYQTLKK